MKVCTWPKPRLGVLSLAYDGSVSSNRSGYGRLIRKHTGEATIAYAGTTHSEHILWVELHALFRGLNLGAEQENHHVEICMDSKVAVEIVQGKCKCHWWALALVGKIKIALAPFQSFSLQHVWREANQAANFLAGYAVGPEEIILYPVDFPIPLQDVIRRDENQCIYTCV